MFKNFEGQIVAGGRLKLNGMAEDITEPLKSGEVVRMVVEYKITAIDHVSAKGGSLTRLHKAAILRTAPIDADIALGLLNQEEERRAALADAANNPDQGTLG